jgi:small-conductance mechanosensitive channel
VRVDGRVVNALVVGGVWVAIVVGLRFGLNRAFSGYERRLAEKDAAVAAQRRTTFSFLLRVIVALVALIGVWSVLSIFTVTQEIARAFLASSAVLALIAGLALTTPLGNLGSGMLLAFTQPVRLGDRITVGEHTGVVDEITLSYTALVTDEARRVFVPNQTMVSTTLVNRSVGDPRRIVTVQVPVRLGASLADARRVATDALSRIRDADGLTLDVQIGEVGEKTVWLNVVGFAPVQSDVQEIAGEIREQVLGALADAELLPAGA